VALNIFYLRVCNTSFYRFFSNSFTIIT
jgi:hypothetical protein